MPQLDNGTYAVYTLDLVVNSKTVNGVEHQYYYADDQLLWETYGNNILDFIYDFNGNPYALIYNGTRWTFGWGERTRYLFSPSLRNKGGKNKWEVNLCDMPC